MLRYTLGGSEVLAQKAGTGAGVPFAFLLHDGQGNTRSLVDNNGANPENYTYDAFGTLTPQIAAPKTRYLYAGQQFDKATGLYSMRARYYAPAQGRFLSRDSASFTLRSPRELNRYGYTANNPINGFDPSGHDLIGYSAQNKQSEEESRELTIVGPSVRNASALSSAVLLRMSALTASARVLELARLAGYLSTSLPMVVSFSGYLGSDGLQHTIVVVSQFYGGGELTESVYNAFVKPAIDAFKAEVESITGNIFKGGDFSKTAGYGTNIHTEPYVVEAVNDLVSQGQIQPNSLVTGWVTKLPCGNCQQLGGYFGVNGFQLGPFGLHIESNGIDIILGSNDYYQR